MMIGRHSGARRFGAHGEEGRGIPWRPPAYSLLNITVVEEYIILYN